LTTALCAAVSTIMLVSPTAVQAFRPPARIVKRTAEPEASSCM